MLLRPLLSSLSTQCWSRIRQISVAALCCCLWLAAPHSASAQSVVISNAIGWDVTVDGKVTSMPVPSPLSEQSLLFQGLFNTIPAVRRQLDLRVDDN